MPILKEVSGIDDIENKQENEVYVFDNKLFVSLDESNKMQIQVYDILGKLKINESITNVKNSYDFQFKGIYLVMLTIDSEIQSYKFIVR